MSAEELIGGQHPVAAVLDSEAGRIIEVWLQRGRETQLARRLRSRFEGSATPLHTLPRSRLDALFPGMRHQGVVVRARVRPETALGELVAALPGVPEPLLVLLDGVEDPHNLGAVLRTADAVGALAVVVPRSRGVRLTPAARRVASGAAESVPVVRVANLARAMEALSEAGIRLVGTATGAPTSLFASDLRGPLALVLGGEGQGLRALTARHCDALVSLPMRGRVASLNVAVTAGVCLYEALRQRLRLNAGEPIE